LPGGGNRIRLTQSQPFFFRKRRINRRTIGVVEGSGRVDVSQIDMPDFRGNLFRTEARAVPASDPSDRHRSAGDARLPITHSVRGNDQRADVSGHAHARILSSAPRFANPGLFWIIFERIGQARG